ncbi:YncE family protein [Chryseobacterium sp. G0201]|uniref:YncE family protein n=1 Tax=Chryseobacterium sp. G0201 TaxID=2487065 RepID=UPI000F4D4045|nr:YncE family protein [Chryseobacterium sp. G0201]AZA55440.1 YncE family protein [Chryseobacterium sp. G0201]
MKKHFFPHPSKLGTVAIFIALATIVSCSDDSNMSSEPSKQFEEKIAVTNRSSGSVSFIDAVTNNVTKTLSIPNSDPMYVVYVPKTDKVYIGDRSGKKIHVVNPKTNEIENSIAVGNGVFHMWADGQGKELWVVNDTDKTISVINLSTNSVTHTIDVGITPHDVFLTKDGSTAFVSVFTSDPNADKVFKYSTSTYAKTGEKTVGKEPHLYHSNDRLYVPCQSGKVYALDGNTLNTIYEKDYAGAHGVFISPDHNNLFVANISGNQLFSINSATGNQIGNPLTSPTPTPHNLVVNNGGDKMFVTHSGTSANTVSTYTVNSSGTLAYSSSITVGNNPFGITYYKREQN